MTADEATMGFGTGLHPPGHSGGVIGVPIAVGEWMSFPEPPDVFEKYDINLSGENVTGSRFSYIKSVTKIFKQ